MPEKLQMPCDFSLITIPVTNCLLFSDINISQGSVATSFRCGGIFSYHFTARLVGWLGFNGTFNTE